MLTRALAFVLAAALAVVLLLAGGQQAALAGGGPGSGSPYGGVACGQSYAPQCTVTAGSGPSAGTPASAGTGTGGQPAAGTAAGGGGAAGGCQGTELAGPAARCRRCSPPPWRRSGSRSPRR